MEGLDLTTTDHHDLIGGMLILAIGVFIIFYAQRYDTGTLTNMGPGYFPLAMGFLMSIFGLMVAIPAFFRAGEPIRVNWRNCLLVIGSLVFYALTLRTLGLLLSTAMAVLISSAASRVLTLKGRAVLVVCIVAVTYVVFILGLSMRLPVLPTVSLTGTMSITKLISEARLPGEPASESLLAGRAFGIGDEWLTDCYSQTCEGGK